MFLFNDFDLPDMKTQDIESYLSSFPNYEVNLTEKKYVDFSLCRIHALLKKMCDPQEALTIVHVAGSKGKGSTCVMVAHILKAAGYVVGLYTSPHLYRLNERIRLLRPEQDKKKIRVASGQVLYDDEIAAEELADVIRALKPVLDGSRFHPEQGYLTYFELLTALGLYYFREQKADVAVLETGLGGRYGISPPGTSYIQYTRLMTNGMWFSSSMIDRLPRGSSTFGKLIISAFIGSLLFRIQGSRCRVQGIRYKVLGTRY